MELSRRGFVKRHKLQSRVELKLKGNSTRLRTDIFASFVACHLDTNSRFYDIQNSTQETTSSPASTARKAIVINVITLTTSGNMKADPMCANIVRSHFRVACASKLIYGNTPKTPSYAGCATALLLTRNYMKYI